MNIKATKREVSFLKEKCWVNNVIHNEEEVEFLFFPYWMRIINDGKEIEIIENPREHPILGDEYETNKDTILWLIGAFGNSDHHVLKTDELLSDYFNKEFGIRYSDDWIRLLEKTYFNAIKCRWYKPWTWIIRSEI